MSEEVILKPNALHMKVSAILGQVSTLPKTGFNKAQNYAFVQESDVLDLIRPQLAAAGIAVYVDIQDSQILPTTTRNGAITFLTTVKGYISFADGDSGETFEFGIQGQGMDSQDKGLPKAITMAVKYGLLKTFLVATGDDSEHETEDDSAPAAPRVPYVPPAAPPVARAGEQTGMDPLPWEKEAEAQEAVEAAKTPGPAITRPPAPTATRSSAKPISDGQGKLVFARGKAAGLTDTERDDVILQITGQPRIDGIPWDLLESVLEGFLGMQAHKAGQ